MGCLEMSEMDFLTQHQRDQFWRDGYLLVENAVTPEQLAAMRKDFASWVEESKTHTDAYGETRDKRPRFDVESGHNVEKPALRRVASPTEVSPACLDVMRNAKVADCVSELIGPSIKFHHGKINSKLPGAATVVKFHQDFPYEPHSNDDLITALVFVDEVTDENGPLEVVPGSHKGPIHSLWHDGVFTGAMDDAVVDAMRSQMVKCAGPAGAVCLMHTRLVHGSAPNRSDHPRTLFICVFSAEDAVPLAPNPLPSAQDGDVIRGEYSGRVRTTPYEMELPEMPKGASFFVQQAKAG
jgi:ectoine hydroxylase-related dioxygenase (phytanoyl-CoA dioxygenase family)